MSNCRTAFYRASPTTIQWAVFHFAWPGLLSIAMLSCSTREDTVLKSERARPDNILNLPAESYWVDSYFEDIDSVTKKAGLNILRKTFIGHDALEVRVWAGFGIMVPSVHGIVIQKSNEGEWRGFHIVDESGKRREIYKGQFAWEMIWYKLQSHQIETLPDSSALKSMVVYLDSNSYVVEILKGIHYRTYHYDLAALRHQPEGETMQTIATILQEEFEMTRHFY